MRRKTTPSPGSDFGLALGLTADAGRQCGPSVESSKQVEMSIWGYSYYRRLKGPQYRVGGLLGLFSGYGAMTELHQYGWRDFASVALDAMDEKADL